MDATDRSTIFRQFALCLRRHHVPGTRNVLIVSIYNQSLIWLERLQNARLGTYCARQQYVISTSLFGFGQVDNSFQTPLGLHFVADRIGAGYPLGTVFKGRKPIGLIWQGQPKAAIAHRILRLAGLELGWNQGGTVDSFDRYIYIHGVGDELGLGQPASRGCIHMASSDILPLFDRIPTGSLVWITAGPVRVRRRAVVRLPLAPAR
jgi:L,D-transpeptidase YbiS